MRRLARAMGARFLRSNARSAAICGLIAAVLCLPAHGRAQSAFPGNQPGVALGGDGWQPDETLLGAVASDFRYAANNFLQDSTDLIYAPAHTLSWARKPSTGRSLLLLGSIFGASLALDSSARDSFRGMDENVTDMMQYKGNLLLWGATGLMYGYGLWTHDARARQHAITAIEAVGVAHMVTSGAKMFFGRSRPDEGGDPNGWFGSGRSFLSSATTPAFAVAAAVSEYADNRWSVAIPAYALATGVGMARMGKDKHWLSDVAMSAIVGVATTRLLLRMHDGHARDSSRFQIFPMVTSSAVGVGVRYIWGGDPGGGHPVRTEPVMPFDTLGYGLAAAGGPALTPSVQATVLPVRRVPLGWRSHRQ